MVDTPNLKLPYILAAQAQKHVTHNEAIRTLDAIVQLNILDRNLTAPPASPNDGDRYLVDSGATGAWAGQSGKIAAFQDGTWIFHTPKEGWIAWIADENVALAYDGGTWLGFSGSGGGVSDHGALTGLLDDDHPQYHTNARGDARYAPLNPATLGVNATADTTNRLAVSSTATLLNHAGAGHQVKVNKNAAADTASFLFQTGFSGRAEMGTTGDDNFHFKVSPDGTTWNEAILVNGTTGGVTFPNTSFSGSGTVTNVATGAGLTGGPITNTGTIALANMPAATLKGNATGASAAPADLTASQVKGLLGLDTATTAGRLARYSDTSGGQAETTGLFEDATGKVGIGAVSPSYSLDVRNATNANQLHLSGTGNDDGAYLLGFQQDGAALCAGLMYSGSDWVAKHATGAMLSLVSNGGGLSFYTASGMTPGSSATASLVERAKITADGKLGVGVAPTAKLHVGGTAGTDGIKFPDQTLQTTAYTPLHLGGDAQIIDGRENLAGWYKALKDKQVSSVTAHAAVVGDSKAAGTSNSAPYTPVELLNKLAKATGLPISQFTAFASPGQGTAYMHSTIRPAMMADANWVNTNLIIYNAGTNDPAGLSLAQTEQNVKDFIDAVRNTSASPAGRSPDNLSIVILGQTTADYSTAISQQAMIDLSALYRRIAREKNCCFVDAYALYRRPHSEAGWMDNPEVHPLDTFNAVLYSILGDLLFPDLLAAGVKTSLPMVIDVPVFNDLGIRLKNTANADGYVQMIFDGNGRDYAIGVGNPSETTFSVANKFYVMDFNAGSDYVRLAIDSTGKVGIGTASPSAKLHVGGTAGVDGIKFPDGTLQTTAATGGGVSDGDKGDITVSGSGAAWTIDADAVSYAKIQNVSATDRLLGRFSAGAGDIEEIACTAAGRALIDDADASAQRTTLGLGTLATQSGTFSGTSSGTNTGDQNVFTTIAVSGQSNVVAEAASDTLTLVAGANITITTDAATDAITIAAASGSGSPGGNSGELQFNNAGAFAGAANAEIHGGDLVIAVNAAPATPPASFVKHFAKNIGGRILPAVMGPSGLDVSLQSHLARNKVGRWNPTGNATTAPLADGIAAPSATGTATARNVATTNMLTSMRRLGYVSAATAGALAGARSGAAQFWRGNAANLGGFFFVARFGVSDAAAITGARMFVGLSATTGAPTNVEPNSLNNSIGVAQISTSNNLQIITRDGATAQTIDLGANFPANTLSADAYELALFAPPNGTTIGYRVERLGTSFVAEGTLSANLPVNTTLMGIQMWRCNNATAAAVGLDLINLYIETDY